MFRKIQINWLPAYPTIIQLFYMEPGYSKPKTEGGQMSKLSDFPQLPADLSYDVAREAGSLVPT